MSDDAPSGPWISGAVGGDAGVRAALGIVHRLSVFAGTVIGWLPFLAQLLEDVGGSSR